MGQWLTHFFAFFAPRTVIFLYILLVFTLTLLHIQHQAPKQLNINAKQVLDNPTSKIFFLHHRVFFKRGHVLSKRRPSLKKRCPSFSKDKTTHIYAFQSIKMQQQIDASARVGKVGAMQVHPTPLMSINQQHKSMMQDMQVVSTKKEWETLPLLSILN